MLAYYLSHPEVRIDPAMPVPDWGLSEVGRARLASLTGREWLRGIARIVSSEERKAVETAEILAGLCGCDAETRPDMHENDRSSTGFLPPQEFEQVANAFFANPHDSIRGWERARDAQDRIVASVRAALAERAVPTLFVGHGGVGTLLKCAVRRDAIDRRHDQAAEGAAPGGGNVHAFAPDLSRSVFGWTAMEELA